MKIYDFNQSAHQMCVHSRFYFVFIFNAYKSNNSKESGHMKFIEAQIFIRWIKIIVVKFASLLCKSNSFFFIFTLAWKYIDCYRVAMVRNHFWLLRLKWRWVVVKASSTVRFLSIAFFSISLALMVAKTTTKNTKKIVIRSFCDHHILIMVE